MNVVSTARGKIKYSPKTCTFCAFTGNEAKEKREEERNYLSKTFSKREINKRPLPKFSEFDHHVQMW